MEDDAGRVTKESCVLRFARTAYGRVPEFGTLINVVTVVAGDDPVNTNFALTE